jgi:guanylate kinase
LLAADENLSLSVSVTTRAPRAGEVEGKHYYFVDQPRFDAMVAAGELLEHAHVFGRSYGTPRAPVAAALAQGRDVLFDIDWQGFRQVKAALPGDVVGVFIKPPSLEALRDRLLARGDAAAEIARRMGQAAQEMAHEGDFDAVVENREFDAALASLREILQARRAVK